MKMLAPGDTLPAHWITSVFKARAWPLAPFCLSPYSLPWRLVSLSLCDSHPKNGIHSLLAFPHGHLISAFGNPIGN